MGWLSLTTFWMSNFEIVHLLIWQNLKTKYISIILSQHSLFYCATCQPCGHAWFDTSCNTTQSIIKNQFYFRNNGSLDTRTISPLSSASSSIHCTACHSCGSAYFDTSMQLHMRISKNHSSPKINSILGTMELSTLESTRPTSIKWPYMHYHGELSSLTHFHFITGINPVTLSTMHTYRNFPTFTYHPILYQFLFRNEWRFDYPLYFLLLSCNYWDFIHCAEITWTYWHKSVSIRTSWGSNVKNINIQVLKSGKG